MTSKIDAIAKQAMCEKTYSVHGYDTKARMSDEDWEKPGGGKDHFFS